MTGAQQQGGSCFVTEIKPSFLVPATHTRSSWGVWSSEGVGGEAGWFPHSLQVKSGVKQVTGDPCGPGERGRVSRLQNQPFKATPSPSVYSASNLLVLLNDGILRKELRKKLPVVRIPSGAAGGKHRD